ncbi:hypothetical protein GCM10023205_03960 [Yinghuangia aomiensis]|uniref:GIY-YIG domain-containing protein n=1 Tax=Yinghuangia aomiensis TaxID=676205 RepID=A0ABP9GMD1_9ACTN
MREDVRLMADWSPWVPLLGVEAPRLPGVYLARWGADGPVVYVGKAGDRDGNGTKPKQGLHGRLRRYTSGKALASGLGEAVFDRALADAKWVRERLTAIESGHPERATDWGKAALAWADLQVCWATTADASTAAALEKEVLAAFAATGVWNRAV